MAAHPSEPTTPCDCLKTATSGHAITQQQAQPHHLCAATFGTSSIHILHKLSLIFQRPVKGTKALAQSSALLPDSRHAMQDFSDFMGSGALQRSSVNLFLDIFSHRPSAVRSASAAMHVCNAPQLFRCYAAARRHIVDPASDWCIAALAAAGLVWRL